MNATSFDSMKTTEITSWNSACRIDAIIRNYDLLIGILDKNGKATVVSVTETEKETDTDTSEKTFSITTLLESIDCSSSIDAKTTTILNVENDALGFRLFQVQENYYFAVSRSLDESTEDEVINPIKEQLFVYCVSNDGEIIWHQQYDFKIESQGLVDDAFIQEGVLVFQFNSQFLLSNSSHFAFWMDIETGNVIQNFTSFYFTIDNEITSDYPVFFPNVILQTCIINRQYVSSIQGFSCNMETIYREEQIPISYNTVEMEELFTETSGYNRQHQFQEPFTFKGNICYFGTKTDYSDKKIEVVLHRYSVVQRKFLEEKVFTLEGYTRLTKKLLLVSENLVIGSCSDNYQVRIVCFDISEKKIVWKKDSYYIDKIGENILLENIYYQNDPNKHSKFILLDPFQNEAVQTFEFETADVKYVGNNSDGKILFYRDYLYISQFDMETGNLEEEILVSETQSYLYNLQGDCLIFTDWGTIGCIDIKEKKLLWKRDIGQYTLNFYNDWPYAHSDWKVTLMNEKEVMVYDNRGSIVFDMQKGIPIRKYVMKDYQIKDSCIMQSGESVYNLVTGNTGTKCMRINYLSPEDSELLEFSPIEFEENYDWGVQVYGFIIQGEEYFVEYDSYGKNTIAISHYPSKENAASESLDFIHISADISNYLYISPYLIFQAILGEKSDNFYLLAYNTEDGSIEKIQKGIYDRIFIQDEKLYFLQDDTYYCCKIGEFDSIEQTEYISNTPAFSSSGDVQPLKEYYEGFPKEYSKLDLFYINAVHDGHFMQSEETNTLFITGDDAEVKIGIMGKADDVTVPIFYRSFRVKREESNYVSDLAFRQSIILDIDQDGLDEVVILTKEYILIADYSQELEKLYLHKLPLDLGSDQKNSHELIKYDGDAYFQYISRAYPLSRSKDVLNKFKIEYNPTLKDDYFLVKCSTHLVSNMYTNRHINNIAPFQFIEKPVSNGEFYITMEPTECEAFPGTVMPCIYEAKEDFLNEIEMTYCQKHNEHLDRFLDFLEEGNDPFDGVEVEGDIFSPVREYTISLTSSKDEKIVLVKKITSFDILSAEENTYILVHILDENNQNHEILFSEDWTVLDLRSNRFLRQNEKANIIVSENSPNCFWIQYYDDYDFPVMIAFGRIVNDKIKCFTKLWNCELLLKEGKSYFKVINADHYIVTYFCYDFFYYYLDEYQLLYLDPFSASEVNSLFRNELLESLDSMYSKYSFNHSRYANLGKYFYIYSHMEIEIPKRRIKKLRRTSGVSGIYETERYLRKYGLLLDKSLE